MPGIFDAIIVGLGGMGSAVAYQLASRGYRVLGFDQFVPPHQHGSSHGRSRVIRQAYFEDPTYVPLLLRAYELWRALERRSSQSLLTITGGLMLGRPESAVVGGSLQSARCHGLKHEVLDATEIRRRFPSFQPEAGTVALYEPDAGFLRPEEAVGIHLRLAAIHGADLKFATPILDWQAHDSRVSVRTPAGKYEAGHLIFCAGPWVARLLMDLRLPLTVERQVQLWFEPTSSVQNFLPEVFPIWIWQTADGLSPYGLPATHGVAGGVKMAIHHGGKNTACTPDSVDRRVSEAEIEQARQCLGTLIPSLNGRCLDAITCLYTNTPDGHFIVDRHPREPRVLVVSPCSGHGFKFCPVIGEIVADVVTEKRADSVPGLFRLNRF